MRRLGQVMRFALVGALVAGTYLVLYLAFLHLGLAQALANALAFLIAVGLQYLGQAAFTFRRKLGDRAQIVRFAVMISLGLIVSAVITAHAASLGLAPAKAALIVMLWLPIQNYLLMVLWVFWAPQLTAPAKGTPHP